MLIVISFILSMNTSKQNFEWILLIVELRFSINNTKHGWAATVTDVGGGGGDR